MYSVFLVDDEPLMIKSIRETIPWQESGFEVTGWSEHPQEAVAQIAAMNPDLVVSDLKMPGMDGLEMIRALKARGVQSEYIILSAYGEFEASRHFFLLEGFDYLLKPIQVPEAELVLEKLSRKLAETRGSVPDPLPAVQGGSFDALVAYVDRHYNKKHSLQDLSARFNLSATYICNLFAKHYGVSLTTFLTNRRMSEAARLTRETDKAFKEIALACGYSDYFYFCKVFKNHFGQPPSAYRQSG